MVGGNNVRNKGHKNRANNGTDNNINLGGNNLRNSGHKNWANNETDYNINMGGNNVRNSGHKNWANNETDYNMNMDNKISKNINKNRHRNIIRSNPPFCKLPNINIGKYFPGLIIKHFKNDSPLRKIKRIM